MLGSGVTAIVSAAAVMTRRTSANDVRMDPQQPLVGASGLSAGYPGQMSRLERITVDPAVCHGQPVVRGLRYPVASLLELLSSGMTIEEVLADYPDLERDDLLAALEFAS